MQMVKQAGCKPVTKIRWGFESLVTHRQNYTENGIFLTQPFGFWEQFRFTP